MKVFLLLLCKLGTEDDAAQNIMGFNAVKQCLRVMPSYDILVYLEGTHATVQDSISKVRDHPSIRSIVRLVCAEI